MVFWMHSLWIVWYSLSHSLLEDGCPARIGKMILISKNGTRVFSREKKRDVGSIYIYISYSSATVHMELSHESCVFFVLKSHSNL